MKDIERLINEKLNEVNRLLNISNKQLAKYSETPNVHIHSSKSNGREQLYRIDGDTHTKKYLKSGEIIKYAGIIQQDYDQKINKKLQRIQKKLNRIANDIKEADITEIKMVYEKQSNAKKQYIKPIIESDEEFIAKWYAEHKGSQNTFPIEGNIYTERGEHVRSKSEKILADLFNRCNIPYVYEPMIKLANGHRAYPDFVLLNKESRQSIYWEHLGLIDQEEYATKNMEKLHEYEEGDLKLGENLMISMESTKKGFNTKIVEKQIQRIIYKSL